MFPWTGLAPAGLVYWLRRREEGDRKSDASVFLVMWFIFAFSLFSLMLTKFHHYILPAVPPAAMLIGVVLDAPVSARARRSGEERARDGRSTDSSAIKGDYRSPGRGPPPARRARAFVPRPRALRRSASAAAWPSRSSASPASIAAMRASRPANAPGGLSGFLGSVAFAQLLVGLGVALLASSPC
jgi:hypothetical protein